MSSFIKINEELPYKEKINHTISYLPDEDKNSFKKALKYYKFDKEVYIPQTMTLNKKEYKRKNYLLNTIVNFNNKLQLGKNYITSLKKQTDKFSKQYQLVEKQNEANQKAFFQGINYIYKIRGYSDRNISYSRNENIFDPSLLLEEQNKFNFVCKTENPIEIKHDTIYLEKFHSILRDKKGKTKEEEEEELEKKNINKSVTFARRQDSSLIGDDYTKSMENVKKQIMEEIRIKNMTFSELKRINDNLKNQIMETESSLMNIDEEYKNKIRYNENVFLSSKGMLRSAKNRYKDKDDIDKKDKSKKNILIIDKNLQNKKEEEKKKEEKKEEEEKEEEKKEEKKEEDKKEEDKKEEEKKEEDKKEEEKKEEENKEDNNKMKKEVHFERNKKITLTERQRREVFQKAKETKLTKIYNSVLKKNYKQEENEIRNYIKLYTNRVTKDPDSNKGSNLHGFLNDFQKQITKTNIPEMANYVGEAMANINRLNRLNKNTNELNIIESCVNPELLYDMDENINNLGYDYAEEILRK